MLLFDTGRVQCKNQNYDSYILSLLCAVFSVQIYNRTLSQDQFSLISSIIISKPNASL